MYRLILFLGICSAFALGRKVITPCIVPQKMVMVGCYHVMSGRYDDPQPHLVNKGIDASLCNYLIYRFVGIGPNGSVLDENPYAALSSDQCNHFNARWKSNPQIRTLAHMAALSDPNTCNFENVFLDLDMRGTIVKNVVDFVKEYVFSGIVLDFSNMHPMSGRPNTDKQNLLLLLKALGNELHREGFILSVSVDTREDTANMFYDIKGISENVNFINLMAFDLQYPLYQANIGSVDHTSTHSHSLNKKPEESKKNIHHVVTHWIGNGVPANKLILGIKLKALSHTLSVTEQFDVDSIREKAEYVNKMELGGVMVRTLNRDDVDGKCGEKFPLLKALNRVLRKKP